MQPKILAFSGSLREGSFNQKLAAVAARGAREAGAEATLISLRELELPLYDPQLEESRGLPPGAVRFKRLMRQHHGFLIASPEHNSSISAALKNAIDWASRKETEDEPDLECFVGKWAAIMAASPGGLGGLRGLVHLRAILGNLHVHVIPDQRAISQAHQAFEQSGDLKEEQQRQAIERIGARLAKVLIKQLAGE